MGLKGRGDRMAREDVIKGLECCAEMSGGKCRECPYSKECFDTNLPYGMPHLAADALAMLKEQEPRTALNIIKVHEGTLGNCPTCGAELIDYYNETHCGRCGQAVKWE